MKYVLDASVALSWVMPRPLTSKALALRDDFRNHIDELIAPSTFGAEVASGLTKAERQKVIPVGDGVHLLADILRTSPLLHAYDPFLFRATESAVHVEYPLCQTPETLIWKRKSIPGMMSSRVLKPFKPILFAAKTKSLGR